MFLENFKYFGFVHKHVFVFIMIVEVMSFDSDRHLALDVESFVDNAKGTFAEDFGFVTKVVVGDPHLGIRLINLLKELMSKWMIR